MSHAWIDGRPVALHAATAEAARLLAASRVPVVAGLGTDIAGARAAIALAERIGAVVDHMSSDAILRDVEVMRATGMMVTTPNEARLRADVLLMIGAGLVEAWPELPARLLVRPPTAHIDAKVPRRIIWLCAGGGPDQASRPRRSANGGPQLQGFAGAARGTARAPRRPARRQDLAVGKSARRSRRRSACRPFWRRGLVAGGSRPTDDRNALWPRRGLEYDDPFHRSRIGGYRQCARRAASLRLDDRLSHAHELWSRLSRT